MAQVGKGKNTKEINVKHMSPEKNSKMEKSVMRESTSSVLDESIATAQNSYEETVAIVDDMKKQMDRQVNIKSALKEHLVIGLNKIVGIVKMEMERRKYVEEQMKDDRTSYTQDLLLERKEHIRKLERIIEKNEITIDSKELIKGMEEKMDSMKEQLKKEIIREIRAQNIVLQEVKCKGKVDIQGLVPEIRKELEKIIEVPPMTPQLENKPLRKLSVYLSTIGR